MSRDTIRWRRILRQAGGGEEAVDKVLPRPSKGTEPMSAEKEAWLRDLAKTVANPYLAKKRRTRFKLHPQRAV